MEENDVNRDDMVHDILIVDDEPEVLEALEMVLRSAGLFKSNIITETDSMAALALLEKKNFDLILADYKMPVMNGIDLLTMVQQKHPNTVRILITGYSDIHIAREAINRAKVHTYIEKPWENDDLRLTVHEALKRKFGRETAKIQEVNKVKEALNLLAEYQGKLTAIPAEHISKQSITLEFRSHTEFNKFSFSLKNKTNVEIDDVQIFEDKLIITIEVKPAKFAYVPKID